MRHVLIDRGTRRVRRLLGLALTGVAAGVILCLGATFQARADDAPSRVIWKTEATQPDQAGMALSQYYAALFNTGQLSTREVRVAAGETPTDVLQREGSWPAFIGPANQLMDSILCDLNRTTCERSRSYASGKELTDIARNVGTTEPSDGDWRGLQADALLAVPDYVIEARYETIVTSRDYVNRKFGKGPVLQPTGAFAAIYCNLNLSVCPGRSPLTWDVMRGAPILLFDPQLYAPEPDDAGLPKGVVEEFTAPDARAVLLAVPILHLRQDISLPVNGNEARFGIDDLQSSLPRNLITSRPLRGESALALQDLNRANLDRMSFLPDDGPVAHEQEELNIRPVTIYHFDRQAKFQHCIFQNLNGVQLFEWRSDDAGAGRPEELSLPDAATGCVLTQGTARRAEDHGTHTLGLLVSQLEAFASRLPVSEVPYFNVVHVPLDGSVFEIAANTSDAGQMERVLSSMRGARPTPDVVSMSLSWPATNGGLLDEKILVLEDLVTFVVAAPDQEALHECARAPAGIKDDEGKPARNVISVIGLKVPDASGQSVALLDGAGAGSKCHEIGAFGELFGPVGEATAVGRLAGSSQATPIVAATVAELMRRLPVHRPSPRRISFRLVSTGWFSPEMINAAKATLLDSRVALSTAEDLIVTNSGCKVFGQFSSIKNADQTKRDNYIFQVDDGTRLFIKGTDSREGEGDGRQLLSFRNIDDARVIVVYLQGGDIFVEVGQREVRVMNSKFIQFGVDRVDAADGTCDAIDPQRQYISIADVKELTIRKFGE